MFQQGRRIGQYHVAGQVTEFSVDLFELVHVDEHECEWLLRAPSLAHESAGHIFKRVPVVDLSQRIGKRLLLGQFLLNGSGDQLFA